MVELTKMSFYPGLYNLGDNFNFFYIVKNCDYNRNVKYFSCIGIKFYIDIRSTYN